MDEVLPDQMCHRAVQNQPPMGDSKPATLRQGVHISSFICCKGKRKIFDGPVVEAGSFQSAAVPKPVIALFPSTRTAQPGERSGAERTPARSGWIHDHSSAAARHSQ